VLFISAPRLAKNRTFKAIRCAKISIPRPPEADFQVLK